MTIWDCHTKLTKYTYLVARGAGGAASGVAAGLEADAALRFVGEARPVSLAKEFGGRFGPNSGFIKQLRDWAAAGAAGACKLENTENIG